MPTPSIQTLVTDAQQVLNLDSISAVRSVVAVALANANTGTPLNPNLTTQQLWNEFYQVVNKPKSDIESIIANQLMKLLYAPPAPGGVGANGQVIFNDNGVLAGDSGLTFNPATDTLRAGLLIVPGNTQLATVGILYVGSLGSPKLKVDVAGTGETTIASATITGDLTVDTNVLKVDTFNNRVGINTASPLTNLHIGSGTGLNGLGVGLSRGATANFYEAYDGTKTFIAGTDSANAGVKVGSLSNHSVFLVCNNATQLQIDPLGVFTFTDGAGGTRMTLNSTGLGVGVSPYASWPATSKALQLGASSAIEGRTNDGSRITLYSNTVWNGTNLIYQNTAVAAYYQQAVGVHSWHTSNNTPSAGNTATFTQAMTLDASGNLLVGVTSTSTPGVGNTTAGGSLNANGAAFFSHASSQALYLNTNVDGQIVSIRRSNVAVGSISVTTTGTTFNSLSDYRLKESVAPLSGGLARISALKPSIYKWKSDGSSGEGFLAHELAEVVPSAVTGDKDAVDADGKPTYQGVDLSKLVPILVAAIQELTARVQTLEAR